MGADDGPLPQVRWHARTRTHRHARAHTDTIALARTHADKLKHACARTCTSFSCRPAILQGWLGRTVPCAAVCCRCGSSPVLWFVHLSGAFVFVGAQTACAITEASEPVVRWLPLASGTVGVTLGTKRGCSTTRRDGCYGSDRGGLPMFACVHDLRPQQEGRIGGAADLDEVRALLHWCETQAECDGALPTGNLRS
jgi:hypothetical protein